MQFKNFGEALSWMMESPENVAVGNSLTYRWHGSILQLKVGERWTDSTSPVASIAQCAWSKAPKEPTVYEVETTVGELRSSKVVFSGFHLHADSSAGNGADDKDPVKVRIEVGGSA